MRFGIRVIRRIVHSSISTESDHVEQRRGRRKGIKHIEEKLHRFRFPSYIAWMGAAVQIPLMSSLVWLAAWHE